MSFICSLLYPRFFKAIGTLLLTIFNIPPPERTLYLTRAISGSIPVVSQSIINAIVPVGARTVVCAFLYPYFSPNSTASLQQSHASFTRYLKCDGTFVT